MEFSGRSSWANWHNVQWTARKFWDTQRSSSVEDAWKRQAAWHHFVMTAGNFKRQTPISLQGLPAVADMAHDTDDRLRFAIEANGEHKTVERDNPESWKYLTEITGMGVATATTVLSAIWPRWHVIADRRAIGVGIGLAYDEAFRERLLRTAGYHGSTVSWERYRWFRPKVIARAKTIGVQAVDMERAMYQIDLATKTNIKTPWDEYRRELRGALNI